MEKSRAQPNMFDFFPNQQTKKWWIWRMSFYQVREIKQKKIIPFIILSTTWWAKRIFLVPRQSNRPVIYRIITSLVHELPPWSVDDTKKSENHFVVISLTDKSEATSVEKKVDMKDAPLVGKLKSTEKWKSLKDWVRWNLIYIDYFLKITWTCISPSMWCDWVDWILTKKFLNIA